MKSWRASNFEFVIVHGVGLHGIAHNLAHDILVRHCIGLARDRIGDDKIQHRLKGVGLNAPFESGNLDVTFSRTIPADS